MSRLRNVCVYCGSSSGRDPVYRRAAIQLSDKLVDRGIRLVNGGGRLGLLGDGILGREGECYGVIPESLKELEVAHLGMTELFVVPDMHTRKLKMVNMSDGFLALPGGYGTLDELFETVTWLQLHIHDKPVVLLNINNYFNPLLDMLDRMVAQGFVRDGSRELLQTTHSIELALDILENNYPANHGRLKHRNP